MKILVGFEESQAITIELRKKGAEAYSCEEKQVGVVYYKGWFCIGKNGDTFPPCVNI